jgi:hypothetical protein
MSKNTYTATAPDGTTGTRKSDREYPYALAVHFPAQPESFDKYANRTRPATDAYWKIVSFHGSHVAAVKGAGIYKHGDRFEVIETRQDA